MSDLFNFLENEGDETEGQPEPSLSDKAIEKQFSDGRLRVIQEKNDFFLIHVVDFIRGKKWGNLRPKYQRRLRWDEKKKSRLIESFIMNVPVPPVFLYENKPGNYEVMDGQQRLSTITEFLENEFPLRGLTIWSELNGRTFKKLPPLLRGSLERAKISAVTLLTDPLANKDPNIDLRAQVFDRLNTGGEKLNAQEIRNSLYSGPFNDLVRSLAGEKLFTDAWDIPAHADNINSLSEESDDLRQNSLYKRMLDCEIVLRFFAFRKASKLTGSVRSILDKCMAEYRSANADEILALRNRFIESLELSIEVFDNAAFRVYNAGEVGKLSRPLFDAVMIAFDRNLAHRGSIIANRAVIIDRIREITDPVSEHYPLIVGRANTADSIKKRIELVSDTIRIAVA